MRNSYRNPTSAQAVGNVEREMRRMEKEAQRIAALRRCGSLTPRIEADARRRFTGIFRHLLEDALNG